MRARGLHGFLEITDSVGPGPSPGELFNRRPATRLHDHPECERIINCLTDEDFLLLATADCVEWKHQPFAAAGGAVSV